MITLGTGLIVTINDRSSEIEGKESFCKKEMGGAVARGIWLRQ